GDAVTPPLQRGGVVRRAEFSPDNRLVLSAGLDGIVQVWDAQNGKPFGKPLKHDGAVAQACFSPDGKRILAACAAGSLLERGAQLWDVATSRPIGPPLAQDGGVGRVAFSRDGRWAATGGENAARVW